MSAGKLMATKMYLDKAQFNLTVYSNNNNICVENASLFSMTCFCQFEQKWVMTDNIFPKFKKIPHTVPVRLPIFSMSD